MVADVLFRLANATDKTNIFVSVPTAFATRHRTRVLTGLARLQCIFVE